MRRTVRQVRQGVYEFGNVEGDGIVLLAEAEDLVSKRDWRARTQYSLGCTCGRSPYAGTGVPIAGKVAVVVTHGRYERLRMKLEARSSKARKLESSKARGPSSCRSKWEEMGRSACGTSTLSGIAAFSVRDETEPHCRAKETQRRPQRYLGIVTCPQLWMRAIRLSRVP